MTMRGAPLNVPHDWSSERSVQRAEYGSGNGLRARRHWLAIAKHFPLSADQSNRIVTVEFVDGIYDYSEEVWVNGRQFAGGALRMVSRASRWT